MCVCSMGPHGRTGRGALIFLPSGRFPMSQGGDGHLEGDGLMTVLILLLVTFPYRREMDAQRPREGGRERRGGGVSAGKRMDAQKINA